MKKKKGSEIPSFWDLLIMLHSLIPKAVQESLEWSRRTVPGRLRLSINENRAKRAMAEAFERPEVRERFLAMVEELFPEVSVFMSRQPPIKKPSKRRRS